MIIAIANQKGGVGKTTTTVNLAGALGDAGCRVLVVDLDPQGNATLHSGIEPDDQETLWPALQQVGRGESPKVEGHDFQALLGSLWDSRPFDAEIPIVARPNGNTYDVVPANLELGQAELDLVSSFSRERCLATILTSVQEYDYVLIDCPPTLGLLTLNGLTAADAIIIPLEAAFFASRGVRQMFKVLLQVKQSLNPRLEVAGVLLTKVDRRVSHSKKVAAQAREMLAGTVNVFETVIPDNAALVEASASGKCITHYSPRSTGGRAYAKLAKEIRGLRE